MGMVVMKPGLVTPEKKKNLAWLGRDVAAMQSSVDQCNLNHVPETVRRVLENEAWREFWRNTLYRFDSFAEFITTSKRDGGCGWRSDYVEALLEKSGDHDTLEMFRKAMVAEHYLQIERRDQANKRPSHRPRSVDNKKDDVNTSRPAGNAAAAALRRLRKDRPDIHKRVLEGEISANAGMIEAGFRKKRTSNKLTALDHLNKWWSQASPDQQAEFWAKHAAEMAQRAERDRAA
jgi:hypothetical protein